MNTESTERRRPIRSFVIRGGRLTKGQQLAWDNEWEHFGLQVEDGTISSQEMFGNDAPIVLEIGFGMGGSLVQMAAESPDINFVGIEVHRPGVGALMMLAAESSLKNLKVYCCDAMDVLEHCVEDASLHRMQLYFPDPWHKKKHNKRRIVQTAFAELIRRKLVTGGHFHMATDWEPYAEHMMEIMSPLSGYRNVAGVQQYAERPDYRPITKFERRGERLGHGVFDLIFEKTNDVVK